MKQMKDVQKSVRLDSRVVGYIEAYRGENFSEKLRNYVLETEERRPQMIQEWELLQAHITDKHAEMRRVQAKAEKLRDVDRRMEALSVALVELLKM